MAGFTEFLSSPLGRIIIGILWGFGLSAMLFNSCSGQICEVPVYQGPNPNVIRRSVFQDGKSKICYKFDPYATNCPGKIF